MEEYKKRLLIEFKELNDKCEKLKSFIQSNPIFEKQLLGIQILMKNQLVFMEGYRQTLYDRINLIISESEIKEFDNEYKGN